MDIIKKIKSHNNEFSKSELKISEAILKNPTTVEQYTITKIAEISSTSKSAVLRFCQKLGFKGYSEFRYEFIRYLYQDNSTSTNTPSDPLISMIDNYCESVTQLKNIDKSLIVKLVEDIKNTSSVYSCGIHKSSILARKLQYNLIDCGKAITLLTDLVSLSHTEFILNKDSLLILFSISGNSQQYIEFLKSTIDINYNSYLITCNSKTPLSKYFKNTIHVPVPSLFNNKHMDEHAILVILVEIITRFYISDNL